MDRVQINRRCAELLGWKWRVIPTIFDSNIKMHLWQLPDGTNQAEEPDFCTDRNAIADLEQAIEARGEVYLDRYAVILEKMIFGKRGNIPRGEYVALLRRADPRQCAEAGLRSVGKWEEE